MNTAHARSWRSDEESVAQRDGVTEGKEILTPSPVQKVEVEWLEFFGSSGSSELLLSTPETMFDLQLVELLSIDRWLHIKKSLDVVYNCYRVQARLLHFIW